MFIFKPRGMIKLFLYFPELFIASLFSFAGIFLESLSSNLFRDIFHLVKSNPFDELPLSFLERFSSWNFTCPALVWFAWCLDLLSGHHPSNSFASSVVSDLVSLLPYLPFSCFTFLFWWSTSCSSFLSKYFGRQIFRGLLSMPEMC